MTARQHIERYESKLREYTNFAVRGIKKVCKEVGPRPGGSEAERNAQEMMQKDMESCCEETRLEPFRVAPNAFMLWIRTGVLSVIASVLAYNLGFAVVSAVLLTLELLFIVLEFILYKQASDWFMPKKQSQNMVAVRKPSGEVKRRLIFCGHADSANEWTYTYLGSKYFNSTKLTVAVVAVAVVTMVFGLIASIIALASGQGWGGPRTLGERGTFLNVLGYIFAGFCVPLLSGWMFEQKRRPVVGANDNLTGCYGAMAALKMMGDLDLRLENTELMVVCSGCEEIGLRGAKAFVKAHAKEFEDVETAFVALDTLTDFEYLSIYIRDLNMTVKHDPAVSAMLRKAANTAGYDVPYENLFFGSSDGTAATQAGMRTGVLAAMDPAPADYYHTRLDTPDRLQPRTIEACLDIIMETAYQYDETGLAPFEGSVVRVAKK